MPSLRRLFQSGSRRQARVRVGTLLLLGVGLLLVGVFWLLDPFSRLQPRLADSLFSTGTKVDGIVIAELDDASLTRYGELTDWTRALHAQAVRNLNEAGARVVVYDLLFVGSAPEDVQFAQAMKNAGNVILAMAGAQPASTTGANKYHYQSVLVPPETLTSAAADTGHVNVQPDEGDRLRRAPLVITDPQGKQWPSVLVAALYAQSQRSVPRPLTREGDRMLVLNQKVPVDESAGFRPNFAAGENDFQRISYGDIIGGSFDEQAVKGKIVLIGATASAIGDEQITPIGRLPGVYVLGNELNSLQQGVFVREASNKQWALGLVPLVVVMMYAVPRFHLRTTVLVALALLFGDYIFSIALFNSDQKLIMNFVYPGMLVPAMFVVGLAHRMTAEAADRRELGDLFGRYASPEIVEELAAAADRGHLDLGGVQREVTVLFADLRGFTGVSEMLPPAEVVDFLNKAFDVMIRCISRHEGVVNKFGGDMIMAIWNAPRDTADHAVKACQAAMEAVQELRPLTSQFGSEFGFGINSGEAVAGNVGSRGRLEYTVMGDPVNVASRLCGIAGGAEILVGERTRDLASHDIEVVSLGPQTLKGRSKPVEAFRVTGVNGVTSSAASG